MTRVAKLFSLRINISRHNLGEIKVFLVCIVQDHFNKDSRRNLGTSLYMVNDLLNYGDCKGKGPFSLPASECRSNPLLSVGTIQCLYFRAHSNGGEFFHVQLGTEQKRNQPSTEAWMDQHATEMRRGG